MLPGKIREVQLGCSSLLDAHGRAIEDCVAAAVKHAVLDLWQRYQEPINLVFGKQKHFGLEKVREYQWLYDFEGGKGRIKTVSMGSPADLPHLQAADILAYEMSKEQRDRKRRYPFKTLVQGAKDRSIPMTLMWNLADLLSDRPPHELRVL